MTSDQVAPRPDAPNHAESAAELTHLDATGNAHMVDVADKAPTRRRAVARARVDMLAATAELIADGRAAKGDVLAVARIAGIQAAKRTSELIPLCHPLMLSSVSVDLHVESAADSEANGTSRAMASVAIAATVETVDRTGVEMEALTACSVAALTIYDMCKAVDREMVIAEIALWEKTGGKSGPYERASTTERA